ncbi:Gfo/Idh/MocA family oxidoreductase [Cytophagaceae bacterium ABcell3]|nr:Gfo/Idh/MocA family oxidoreductase [Cytophagaceae bacterium ABcell3]
MKNGKYGIALVGLGKYATNQLAQAIEHSESFYLAGIVTGSPDKAKKWKEKYNLKDESIYDYSTFDNISKNKEIEVVYIVLPNSMHAEYTIRAAQAGKHVICEKPMASNTLECKQMISACEDAGVRLLIGYRLHFEPHNQEIIKLGQEKELGNIKHIKAGFGFEAGSPGQWRLKKMFGGGALMDVGIYCIQAARHITGMEPLYINYAEITRQDGKFEEVDGEIKFEIEFPGEIKAVCEASFAKNIDYVHAETEEGWFELSPAFEYQGLKGSTSNGPLNIENINQQKAQLDAMADAIYNNTEITADAEEGLKDMGIIEAIFKAAETGKPVNLTEKQSLHQADRRW